MSFLKRIELTNFRIFKEPTAFEFAPITILVGANNSGKSTLIKAIQLLYESTDDNFMSLLNKGTDTGYHQINDLQYHNFINKTNDDKLANDKKDNLVITFKIDIEAGEDIKNGLSNPLSISLQYKSGILKHKLVLSSLDIVGSDGEKIIDGKREWYDNVEMFYITEVDIEKEYYDTETEEKYKRERKLIESLSSYFANKFNWGMHLTPMVFVSIFAGNENPGQSIGI